MWKTSQLANRLHPQLLQAGATELLWRRFEVSREVVHDKPIETKKSGVSLISETNGSFLKWWVSPTTHGVFLLKMDHLLGCENGGNYHHSSGNTQISGCTFKRFFFPQHRWDSEWVYPFLFFPEKFRSASCRCATRTASWLHNVESPWDGQQMWRNHWWLWPFFDGERRVFLKAGS